MNDALLSLFGRSYKFIPTPTGCCHKQMLLGVKEFLRKYKWHHILKRPVTSYLSVHEGLANKSKMYSNKYAQFVVDYAMEWEKVVVARVSTGLKKAEQLRVEVDHYQAKVESLRKGFLEC